MGIKAVLLDISNTTLDKDGVPHEGIPELIDFCRSKSLKIIFITNNVKGEHQALISSGLYHDLILTPQNTRKWKPSPGMIKYAMNTFNLANGEIVYIGDDDRADAWCAANAKVLYLAAKWANPKPTYGIRINTPLRAKKFIEIYLLKNSLWAWSIDRVDRQGKRTRIHAMLDCNSAYMIKKVAVDTMKYGHLAHRPFLLMHLISAIYSSGFYKEIDYWATYPSHNEGDSINDIMKDYLKLAEQEFRKQYLDLFYRHKTSKDSGTARHSGSGGINFKTK